MLADDVATSRVQVKLIEIHLLCEDEDDPTRVSATEAIELF